MPSPKPDRNYVLKLIKGLEATASKNSFADVYNVRELLNRNDRELHNKIAPLEHRAFTKEVVKDNPLGAAFLPFAIPAYSASKALGFEPKARSDASIEEMMQGYKGLVDGIINAIGISSDEEDAPISKNTKVASSK